MNTDPKAIKVLCYGDSNTWGQKPDKSGRYPPNLRWTGRVQGSLGTGYYIIEEGLSSRTTDLEYQKKPGRNGKTYLIPCLESHNPLDIVILMLGTNDLKIEFDRSSHDIAEAINGLVSIIKEHASNPNHATTKIILISPIYVNDQAPLFTEYYADIYYNAESVEKSKALANEIKMVAKQTDCLFIDAAQVAAAGEDGIHFSEEAHANLASTLLQVIKGLS